MSALTLFSVTDPQTPVWHSTDAKAIQDQLNAKGVRFERWQADRDLALAFLDGYGKTDLEGQLAYISLFEARTAQALEAARRDVSSKSRLYTMLGFFSGTVTALILI